MLVIEHRKFKFAIQTSCRGHLRPFTYPRTSPNQTFIFHEGIPKDAVTCYSWWNKILNRNVCG